MNVRAKLLCTSVKGTYTSDDINSGKTGENLTFEALYTGNKEDNEWSTWTPSASFRMYVTNPIIFGNFEVGKSYYFDINPCE